MVNADQSSKSLGALDMGFGERLSRVPSPLSYRVDCPEPKSAWRVRDPGDQIRPVFPGTAVVIEGDLFEVREHRPPGSPGHQVEAFHAYLLAPWENGFPVRPPTFSYSREALRAERAQNRIAEAHQRRCRRLDRWGLIVSLLPGPEQIELRRLYGFDGVAWTRRSAVVITFLIFAIAVTQLDFWFSGAVGILCLLALAALFVEQYMRRARAVVGEPSGSMFGHLYRVIVGKR